MRYDIDTIMDNMGRAIRVERVKRGLTQCDLADLSNIGSSTISQAEHLKRLTKADTLLMICNGLDMSIEDLIKEAEELAK